MAGWFLVVEQTIKKYSILKEDIYNVDETGFAMGPDKRYSIDVGTDTRGTNFRIVMQSDKREWKTAIERIIANGEFLPPTVISKGKVLLQYHVDALPLKWYFATSKNGWTNNELGYYYLWLKENFLVNTTKRTHGTHRLPDGHGSHATQDWMQITELS